MRIPQTWCQMAGSAAPPLTMSVAAWLNGDKDRDGLLARSLALEKLIGLVCKIIPRFPESLITIFMCQNVR